MDLDLGLKECAVTLSAQLRHSSNLLRKIRLARASLLPFTILSTLLKSASRNLIVTFGS
jgi:hypothetical protein